MMASHLPDPVYVYGLPRSGSNLFAAFLHCHEEIWSINCGGGEITSVRDWSEAKDRCIYVNGGYRKSTEQIRYFVFDEMKPPFGVRRLLLRPRAPKLNIITVRNPLAVATSMINFSRRYGQNLWDLSAPDRLNDFVTGYRRYLKACARIDGHWVSVVEFFADLPGNIKRLLSYLDLDDSGWSGGLPLDEKRVICSCGGNYVVRETNKIHGTFFRRNNITKDRMEPALYCTRCDSHLLGYGGFNPLQPIDVERLSSNPMTADGVLAGQVLAAIERVLGAEFRRRCEEARFLTSEQLREFSSSL